LRGEDKFELAELGVLKESTEPSVLYLIKKQDIWAWIDEDAEIRARDFASFVPPALENMKTSLARAFLKRYGSRADVRLSFSMNYSRVFGWGSLAEKMEKEKELLVELCKKETDLVIRQWIDEHLDLIESDIERERIREEQMDYRGYK